MIMTEQDVRSLLKELDGKNFGVLSRAQLERLERDLRKHIDLIERETVAAEITAFESTVPPRARKLYQAAIKSRGLKKPAKSAPPAKLRAYLDRLRDTWKNTQSLVKEIEAELGRLKAADDQRALQHIKGLSAERRKLLSSLAGLTRMGPKGSAALNLSTAEKNNRMWLAELRKKMTGSLLSAES